MGHDTRELVRYTHSLIEQCLADVARHRMEIKRLRLDVRLTQLVMSESRELMALLDQQIRLEKSIW